jgi:hypothetical protein
MERGTSVDHGGRAWRQALAACLLWVVTSRNRTGTVVGMIVVDTHRELDQRGMARVGLRGPLPCGQQSATPVPNLTSSIQKNLFLSLPRMLDAPGGIEPLTTRVTQPKEMKQKWKCTVDREVGDGVLLGHKAQWHKSVGRGATVVR